MRGWASITRPEPAQSDTRLLFDLRLWTIGTRRHARRLRADRPRRQRYDAANLSYQPTQDYPASTGIFTADILFGRLRFRRHSGRPRPSRTQRTGTGHRRIADGLDAQSDGVRVPGSAIPERTPAFRSTRR
jgi:hypothetical protein